MTPVCYQSSKRSSRKFCAAFAAGCGGRIVRSGPYQPGKPAAIWGVSGGTLAAWRAMRDAPKPNYYYGDNGYIMRGEYQRVTYNGTQVCGAGDPDWKRYDALKIKIAHWTGAGSDILLCPHSADFHAWVLDESVNSWLRRVTLELRKHTDRRIRIRRKPGRRTDAPFENALADCWAVVTPQSACAIEAIINGVPAITTEPCAATPVAYSDLSLIESPMRPAYRADWLAALATNQWTWDEIRSGECWAALRAKQHDGARELLHGHG